MHCLNLSTFLSLFLSLLSMVSGNTYSVRIGTESHVNLIDGKFLSFTIDPKYLFSSSEKYRSKECICMASSLTPAYIRIAGPSTEFLSFHNATIAIEDLDGTGDEHPKVHFQDFFAENLSIELKSQRDQKKNLEALESRFKRNHDRIEVSHKDWRKFIQWAKSTGFDLVFALNHQEKMDSGMWDPNTALNILTVAEKVNIGDMFWQLGYECKNQSIEEYLNDLETLAVIIETFTPGRSGQWKVVGGDVTKCLQADSKSDFKDYVTLSNDMMDAILFNGNSSTQELQRMSERDRHKLLKLLSHSDTPLWLTEAPWSPYFDELTRAADWLIGLGHAAKNGFSHHFRELGDEMYEPTLSFYMALLFKNLVGSKVLDVEMEPDQAIMFAHCTSLRHKSVPGAVTLYGVNMDDEPARFSIKFDKREEGGDIMQFILGHDSSGNIQVNGHSMYFEGDLKPVVKRVRPYKTLLINLPARSFGFWVLANTKINACYDDSSTVNKEFEEAVTIESGENERLKTKRSLEKDFEEYTADNSVDFIDDNDNDGSEDVNDENLVDRIRYLNKNLNKVQELFKDKTTNDKRIKRQIYDESLREKLRKLKRRGFILRRNKKPEPESKSEGIFSNISPIKKRNITRRFKNNKLFKSTKISNNKVSKRNPKTSKRQEIVPNVNTVKTVENPLEKKDVQLNIRQRRNADKDQVELSVENEIDVPKDNVKLWKILRKIHKELKDLSQENDDYVEEREFNDLASSEHIKEKVDDPRENDSGFIKSTVDNLMRVLSDLNKNLNRFWKGINLLD